MANPSLGRAAQPSEAVNVGPWEPHVKTEDPAVSPVRLDSRPSPATAPDVRFRLAFGFEAGPVNHYMEQQDLSHHLRPPPPDLSHPSVNLVVLSLQRLKVCFPTAKRRRSPSFSESRVKTASLPLMDGTLPPVSQVRSPTVIGRTLYLLQCLKARFPAAHRLGALPPPTSQGVLPCRLWTGRSTSNVSRRTSLPLMDWALYLLQRLKARFPAAHGPGTLPPTSQGALPCRSWTGHSTSSCVSRCASLLLMDRVFCLQHLKVHFPAVMGQVHHLSFFMK